jgi:hypothetical protein
VVERGFGGYGEQLGEGVRAENLVDALGWPGYWWGLEQGVGGRQKLELLAWMDKGVVGYEGRYVGEFGGFRAEKFAPGWGVEEEILNGDRGSSRQGCVFDAEDFSACDFDACASGSI